MQVFAGGESAQLLEVSWFDQMHIKTEGGLLIRKLKLRPGDHFISLSEAIDQSYTLNPIRSHAPSTGLNHHSWTTKNLCYTIITFCKDALRSEAESKK
jgi:hypothetical protein